MITPHEISLAQHCIRNVLRCYFQLTGNMVLYQIGEKLTIGVFHQIVKANTRADEYLFDPGDIAQFPQQHHIISMVSIKIRTSFGRKTSTIFAHTML